MAEVTSILDPLLRWIHVVAGILWIGHLYFFNFVNAQVAKTYDADSKKKVVPELMPRALYWFRWGSAYTFITGFLLFGLLYSAKTTMARWAANGTMVDGSLFGWAGTLVVVGLWVVGFLVYDQLWKSPLGKNEMAAAAVSYLLVVGAAFGLSRVMSSNTVFIAIGGLLGTIMAGNVWMRIWPAQKKIIGGIKGVSPAPDASVAAFAGLRSKHNTYMSVPLVFLMLAPSHLSKVVIVSEFDYLFVAGSILAGWAVTRLLYIKSATDAPKSIGAASAAPAAKAS